MTRASGALILGGMPDDRERLRASRTDEPQTPAELAAALGLPDEPPGRLRNLLEDALSAGAADVVFRRIEPDVGPWTPSLRPLIGVAPDAIGVGFVRAGAGFLSCGREARS